MMRRGAPSAPPMRALPSTLQDPILAEVQRFYEEHHAGLVASRKRHRYYYDYLARVLRGRAPQGQRILDLGSRRGALLDALLPSEGVGIGTSRPPIEPATG